MTNVSFSKYLLIILLPKIKLCVNIYNHNYIRNITSQNRYLSDCKRQMQVPSQLKITDFGWNCIKTGGMTCLSVKY